MLEEGMCYQIFAINECLEFFLASPTIINQAVRGGLCFAHLGQCLLITKSSHSILGGMHSTGVAGDSFGSQSPGDSLNHCCLASSLGPRGGSLQSPWGKPSIKRADWCPGLVVC